MISESLSGLPHLSLWSLVLALAAGIFFASIGLLLYKWVVFERETPLHKKEHPFLRQCRLYLARFGLFSKNPLNKSFEYALTLLRNVIGGTQYRYRLPWIVALGAENAGKTTLLRNLDLDRAIDHPDPHAEEYEKPLCDWWFFDHGVVLDLNGHLVINQDKALSDEADWDLFLNLLGHYRPARPLDGVILTIPASELRGKTKFSHDDLTFRANYLYDKLWQMQRVTSFRVPIYIVVTKCDLLPGFESVCKDLPQRVKSDMFGWSNDKALDSVYTPEWIDEAFASINSTLSLVQEDIYAEGDLTGNRDGVFLFPLAFNELKDPLQAYMNQLFKASDYHESFFLRGIYFVGDSHLDDTSAQIASYIDIPHRSDDAEEGEVRNIYFANDLFEKKIFREVGLARPVARALLGNTTSIRLTKIIIALLVVLATFGLLKANEQMQAAKLNLTSILPHIDITLEKVRGHNENTDIGRLYFDQQAQTTLDALTQMTLTNVVSPYLPPSWVSPLASKLQKVMIIVYDKVILRSMGSQLNYKAKKLVAGDTIPLPAAGQVFTVNPLGTPEFQRLLNFLVNLQALENAAKTFNALNTQSSLESVARIIKYLFNYDMPDSFYVNSGSYLSALENTNIQPFDFKAYQGNASSKLDRLFNEFQTAAFDPDRIVPGLAELSSAFDQFSDSRNSSAYNGGVLRNVFEGLQQTIDSIESPGFAWVNESKFSPGPQYDYAIQLIENSNFLVQSSASTLTTSANKNFIDFRKRLGEYTSPLLQDHSLFVTEDGLAIAEPTKEALALAQNLKSFFSQPFMAPVSPKDITTAIPTGSVLVWDTLRLQDGVNLLNKYNTFMDSHFLSIPERLRPLLHKIAQESLTQHLVSLIATAQVFSPRSNLAGNCSSPEDGLLSQVQNYRAATPYLEQLLVALKDFHSNNAFMILKRLLTTQAYTPLEKLNQILLEEAPYALKMNSFNWWSGKPMAALEAFSVGNMPELRSYLTLQRERINYLAHEFAKPLVALLECVNSEGMPGNLPLVTKWEGILSALDNYSRKSAGSSLAALEDFIIGPLNEVTLGTCAKYIESIDTCTLEEDFFTEILMDIEEKLKERCASLTGCVSLATYAELASFFNKNLSGRFPFAAADTKAPDASPDDIRTFFYILDGQTENIKKTLAGSTGLGAQAKNALTFIEQMEKVKHLLGGFLSEKQPLPDPAFTFDLKFRANRAQESHGNEILDWTLTSHDATLSIRSTCHKGYWTTGDQVQVAFKWAANSPLQPARGSRDPSLEIQGTSAVYTYTGTWALLRLIQEHLTPLAHCGTTETGKTYGLRFEIPLTKVTHMPCKNVISKSKAVVFLSLCLSPLGKPLKPAAIPIGELEAGCTPGKTKTAELQERLPLGECVEWPHFPCRAPELPPPSPPPCGKTLDCQVCK